MNRNENWTPRFKITVFVLISLITVTASAGRADSPPTYVEKVQRFRLLLAEERWEEARRMLSPDPRRWFETREGAGRRWTIGPGSGPWSRWDEEFRSTSMVVEWREEEWSATVRVREINDYFRLLERGAQTNEVTYFFDPRGLLDGLLIRAVGERPAGRTEEFLRWAKQNEPQEIQELMPDGEIDPGGDHPQRFRALLERWRNAVGLPEIADTH